MFECISKFFEYKNCENIVQNSSTAVGLNNLIGTQIKIIEFHKILCLIKQINDDFLIW